MVLPCITESGTSKGCFSVFAKPLMKKSCGFSAVMPTLLRRHYENGYNNVADFIEAHDDTLPPELLEEARAAAHAAGLPFSEKPYRDGEDFNPYVFDGSMSIEDFELMHRMMNKERSKRMSETFSILIDSRTRFETGKPGGEWLSMPTVRTAGYIQ